MLSEHPSPQHLQGDSLFLLPIQPAISNPSWHLFNLVFCLWSFKSHTIAFTFWESMVKWFLIYSQSHASIIANCIILPPSRTRNPASLSSHSLRFSVLVAGNHRPTSVSTPRPTLDVSCKWGYTVSGLSHLAFLLT